MYITCKLCHMKNHISEWAIFPRTKHLVEAICPSCKKTAQYKLTI